MTPAEESNDRLASVEQSLQALTGAVNAIASRQKPGPIVSGLRQPAAWIAIFGFLVAVAAFTIRNVNLLQSNTARINVLEDVVPVVGINIERIAASLDNLCANLAANQRARGIGSLPCPRTLIDPFVVPRR